MPDEALIDNGNCWGGLHVLFGEVAAPANRNAHSLQVIKSDGVAMSASVGNTQGWMAFDGNSHVGHPPRIAYQIGDCADGSHSRQVSNSLKQILPIQMDLGKPAISLIIQRDLRYHD